MAEQKECPSEDQKQLLSSSASKMPCLPSSEQKDFFSEEEKQLIWTELPASAQWKEEFSRVAQQDVARMLTILVGQQQGLKEQLAEMARTMQSSFDCQERIKDELLTEFRDRSLPNLLSKDPRKETERPTEAPVQERTPPAPLTVAPHTPPTRPGPQERISPIPEEVSPAPQEGAPSSPDEDKNVVKQKSPRGEKQFKPSVSNISMIEKAKDEESIEGVNANGVTVKDLRHWRHVARHIVANDRFEMLASALIIANSVVLVFSVQYKGLQVCYDIDYHGCNTEAAVTWGGARVTFSLTDWFFGLAFLAEALIKIFALGLRYFWDGRRSPWNWLDFTCVVGWFVDKGASAFLPFDPQALRMLRLLRLMRLVRLLRILESLDVLYIMTTAIRGMSKVVAYAILLLTMMLATCALFLTQVLHASYFNEASAVGMDPEALERQQKLYEYFGTFTRCVMSMFELTLANWPPVMRLLAEEVSEWFFLICLIHKLTIGFAVIGVINGVIMQETFKVAANDDVIMVRQKKRAAQIGAVKMKQLFDKLNANGDGDLDFEEFELIAQNPEVKTWLASMDIETDDMHTLFKLIDFDGSGSISKEELVMRIPRIKGTARSLDVLAMRTRLNEVMHLLTELHVGINIPSSVLDKVNIGGVSSAVPSIR